MMRARAGRNLSRSPRRRTSDHPLRQRRTEDLPFPDDQGRRISPADRRWFMKRCLLAAIFLIVLRRSAPAAETPSELKLFVRGAGRKCCVRTLAGRRWCISGASPAALQGRIAAARTIHEGPFRARRRDDQRRSRSESAGCCARDAGEGRAGAAENWLFSDGFVERLRFEIDPAWQGEIPRTLLIARRNCHHDRGFGGNTGPRKMAPPKRS